MDGEVIRKGFWSSVEFNHSRLTSTTLIEEYQPSEKLVLFITQLDYYAVQNNLSKSQLRKLVDSWCSKLRDLKEVRYLWLPSRVSQTLFDAICEMENLEGLWIKWSGIRRIEKLGQLRRLKHLHIGSSSQVEGIEILGTMKSLITLETEQLNKVNDFSVIGELTQLKGLGIDGSMWTAQKINDIDFASKLVNLQYFTLTNTVMKKKSFDPLLQLQNLERFVSSWNYPESEFEKLKRIKSLKFGNVETSWREVKQGFKNFRR